MAILNVTYNGRSADISIQLDIQLDDAEVKRLATELLRSGGVHGMHYPELPLDALRHYVVDRFHDEQRMYLRPKVPFGAIAGSR